jgi:N6-L-threonylcarbamoyladenine synthase
LDFSFSGLKSAALREIQNRLNSKLKTQNSKLSNDDMIEISYSYQKIITDILVARTLEAQKKFKTRSICIVGGVSANSALRSSIEEFSKTS